MIRILDRDWHRSVTHKVYDIVRFKVPENMADCLFAQIHGDKCAKRVFGIPDFKYYALGDGLGNIFSRFPGPLRKEQEILQSQLSFGFG